MCKAAFHFYNHEHNMQEQNLKDYQNEWCQVKVDNLFSGHIAHENFEISKSQFKSECGKMRVRITPNKDTFRVVTVAES